MSLGKGCNAKEEEEEYKCMFMPRHQNAGQMHKISLRVANISLEIVAR
jgi:hypothetical protein